MIFQTCGQGPGVSGRIRIDLDFITPLESFMNTSIPYRATTPWNDAPRAIKRRSRAFTLIELLVVFIIISILSSLMLAGLAGARQRAKTDKTKSTIRKIDSVIRPMFDSYRTRRVDIPPPDPSDVYASKPNLRDAYKRMFFRRTLLMREMPDSWRDVPSIATEFNALPYPKVTQTAAVRSYTYYRLSLPTYPDPINPLQQLPGGTPAYESAECLFMILSRSGFESDALEMFRSDEIGDIDNDGAKEFWDGWGRPIAFMRWAPGFTGSLIQVADGALSHDPLDPYRVDTQSTTTAQAYALIPLIYSSGPDGSTVETSDDKTGYGLEVMKTGWSGLDLGNLTAQQNSNLLTPGTIDTFFPLDASDNITNHDLLKK